MTDVESGKARTARFEQGSIEEIGWSIVELTAAPDDPRASIDATWEGDDDE